jgi:hypothetical protein
MSIRPSALPKLALCGQYESAPGEAGPAAQRGTMLDKVFREGWQSGLLPNDLVAEDLSAVAWAIETMKWIRVWEGSEVLTDEDQCKIPVPSMQHIGTADAICVEEHWLADLKSGQIYNYKEQMAAYALGLMSKHNVQKWKTYLLFCDARKVVIHDFSFYEALQTVRNVILNVGNDPVVNEYCGWCRHSLTCEARVAEQEAALAVKEEGFPAILADPVRLGEFLTKCKTLDAFRDSAKEKARELLEQGSEVDGWRLQKPRITEFVEAHILCDAVSKGLMNYYDVIRAQGNLSATKARKLYADVPVERKESQPALVSK